MQQEGKPRFLKYHQQSVRGVAFSPRVSLLLNFLIKPFMRNILLLYYILKIVLQQIRESLTFVHFILCNTFKILAITMK